MMKPSLFRSVRCAVYALLVFGFCVPVFAEEKVWHVVPEPDDSEERYARFLDRNSDEAIEELAHLFVAMLDLSQVPAEMGQRYVRGDYAGTLESYRDFFVQRMRRPDSRIPSLHPNTRVFLEHMNQPEAMLDGRIKVAMVEHRRWWNDPPRAEGGNFHGYQWESHQGDFPVHWEVQPGRFNWAYAPEGFKRVSLHYAHAPDGGPALAVSYLRQPHFFNALLAGYLDTGHPAYMEKWAEFIDDRYLHLNHDARTAGVRPRGGNMAYHLGAVLPGLRLLAETHAEFDELLPAPTLARILVRMWTEYAGDALYGGRRLIANRRVDHAPASNFGIGLMLPEFQPALYFVREYARIIESYAHTDMMPDGSGIEYHTNYNGAYLNGVPRLIEGLSKLEQPPSWMATPWEIWLEEQEENRALRARYLRHLRWPTGSVAVQNLQRGTRSGWDNWDKFSPGYSEAFPFQGSYLIRTGWDADQDQFLYLFGARPMASASWKNANNFNFHAYGENLFRVHHHFLYRDSVQRPPADRDFDAESITYEFMKEKAAQLHEQMTPVLVDDGGQIDYATNDRYPPEYRTDSMRPLHAVGDSTEAYRDPLKNRWHESESFNFAESLYDGPYTPGTQGWREDVIQRLYAPVSNPPDEKPFIHDTTHKREILFVRDAGLWIITDRMQSEQPRTYRLGWPFDIEVEYRAVQPDRILTHKPDAVNLSIYSFATSPDPDTYGVFSGKDEVMVSALYARPTIDQDLKDIAPLRDEHRIGFEATTDAGVKVTYQTRRSDAPLQIDALHVKADVLVTAQTPAGILRGVILGAQFATWAGTRFGDDLVDFEFSVRDGTIDQIIPIHVPLDLVDIHPAPDRFSERVEVTLSHPEPGLRIHYTLDGRDPTASDPEFKKPIVLEDTTVVKARGFRPDVTDVPPTVSSTEATLVSRAVYVREAPMEPIFAITRAISGGMRYVYREEQDWTVNAANTSALPIASEGHVTHLFDMSARASEGTVSFEYTGYLHIPQAGVYSFHAPANFIHSRFNPRYDLRVYVGGREWYPATRSHNFGNWSIPMKAGWHAFKVHYLDFGADAPPTLEISGPELSRQPIPHGSLFTPLGHHSLVRFDPFH